MELCFPPRQSDTSGRSWMYLTGVAVLAVACGSGRGNPATGAGDGGDGSLAAADGAGDADAATVPPRPPIRGTPLPVGVAPARRILGPEAMLTGDGASACSHQEPPSTADGHRWCAFTRPSTDAARAELWVFDLTALAGGEPLRCETDSPICRRLTETLWTGTPLGGPSHPHSHAFDGDTLIFYADGSAGGASDLHRGPVYAWRPGWGAARLISSAVGLLCRGHARAAVAHCLDDLAGDPLRPDSFELRAGTVRDDPAAGPLPSLGRVRPLTPDGETAWQAGFSPAGDVLAVSSPATDPTVPVLRLHTLEAGAPGAAVPVARDVRRWRFSHDGRRLYLLRQPAPGAADLSVVGRSPPQPELPLASHVQSFELVGDGSADRGLAVLVLEAGRRVLRLMGDPAMPGGVTGVFTHRGTPEAVRVSFDGQLTAWISDDFVGRLVRHADQSICQLNTGPYAEVFRLGFMGNARLLLWTESAPDEPDRRDGFFARPDDCRASRRFGHGVQFLQPIGERGVILGDELDERNERVTLKYLAARPGAAGFALDEPVRVDENVDQYVTVASERPVLLLYRKRGQGPEADGVYLFGPVPF